MNVNELASSVYGNYQTTLNKTSLLKLKQNAEEADTESFADVLTGLVTEKSADVASISDSVKEIADGLLSLTEEDDDDSTKVIDLLSDAKKAQEYLSSQSGKNLLFAMAEREISSIVTSGEA